MAGVDDRLVEAAARDPLGRALEPQDPRRVHRCEQIADDDGEEQPDQAGDEQPPLDQIQARERVGERVAEQDHDRPRSRAGPRPRRSCGRAGRPCRARARGSVSPRARDRIACNVERRGRVRVAEDERLVLEHRVDDDARLEDGGRPLGELLLARRPASRSRRATVFASSSSWSSFAFTSSVSSDGHDDQVDDAERAGDDEQQREREPKPDPRTRRRTLSARGSGSRRREP